MLFAASTTVVAGIVAIAVAALNNSPPVCQFPEGFEFPDSPAELVDGPIPTGTLVSSLEWEVDPSVDKKYQVLVKIDTQNPHQIEALGPEGAAVTISPDRRQVSYLTIRGDARQPHLWNVDSGVEEPWRREEGQEVCTTTQRVSWNQSGTRLAALCTDQTTGDSVRDVFVFDVATNHMTVLTTPGIPNDKSAPTWIGDDALIYGQSESKEGPVNLWMFQTANPDEDPVQITNGVDDITNPDWSPYDGGKLLFLRSAAEADAGGIWTCTPDGEGSQWGSKEIFRAPTWSPDGTAIAFLIKKDEESEPILAWSALESDLEHAKELAADPEIVGSHSQMFDGVDLTQGTRQPPAWGSR